MKLAFTVITVLLFIRVLAVERVLVNAAEASQLGRNVASRVESQGATTKQPLAVLTNVVAVRALTSKEAAQHWSVRLRGVVLLRNSGNEITICDDTGGIYMQSENAFKKQYERGDILEVEGVSDPGNFAPTVRLHKITRIGQGSIPAPRPAVLEELLTGVLDAQWVQISGVIRQIEPAGSETKMRSMTIFTGGGRITVLAPIKVADALSIASEVRLAGVCFHQFNKARQVLNPILVVPVGEAVVHIRRAPANPYTLPVRSIRSLEQFKLEESRGYGVRIQGVVTHADPEDGVWIQDTERGLHIRGVRAAKLQVGEKVDVFGFVSRGGYSPTLEDALFRKTGTALLPTPVRLSAPKQMLEHDADLVELNTEILEVQPLMRGVLLTLMNGKEPLTAMLRVAGSDSALREWRPGCLVRVAGICQVETPMFNRSPGTQESVSFRVLLRTPADLQILKSPSWWTPQHIIWVMGIVAGTLVVLLFGVLSMTRLHHLQQARARMMAEAEFAAVFNERSRIAREIHDTLAQGLTAISVNLDLAWRQVPEACEGKQPLGEARSLTRASLANVRNTIWNMRSQVLETGDLATALGGILKIMPGGDHIKSELRVLGIPRRFAPVTENNILRIGQEAITNAARHAEAKNIEVVLAFEERGLRLSITDDGKGFDPAHPPKSKGGFGLIGMRERAVLVRGKLNILSEAGKGTMITLEVFG
ncbi:MAG: sensor histidine kinase [bacterium]